MRTAAYRGSVCSLTGGGKPRADVLGGFVGILLLLLVTIISSSAGPANGRVSQSRPAFSDMANRAVLTRNRVWSPGFYAGYRQPSNFHGPLVVTPGWRANSENATQNVTSNPSETRTEDPTSQAKDPNRLAASQSLSPRGDGTLSISPPRNPISPPRNPINPLPSLNAQPASPAQRSETAATINQKFEQAENKVRNESWRSPDCWNRLERSRVFFIGLIDVGYPLQQLDDWCDDLLDDQVDTGMPVDLIDSYWGQPVSTQQYVEYYTPYQVATYQTPDGNYRQVTFQNGVVTPGM